MTKKTIYKLITACLAVALTVFALAACDTYAWLIREREDEHGTVFGDFRVTVNTWFDDGTSTPRPPVIDGDAVHVSLDRTAPDYWRNLRTDIIFEGTGEAYLRVMIFEIWTETVTDAQGNDNEFLLRAPFVSYYGLRNSYWLDNRRENPQFANDMFVYYFNPASAHDDPFMLSNPPDNPRRVLRLITGVPEFATVERPNVSLRIRIRAEAVQRNRYREVWGIGSMPVL